MADRVFERVLQQTSTAEPNPDARRQKAQANDEAAMRKLDTGMTASDAIQRMLLAAKDKDYFRLLELPPPEVDALGRPAWNVKPLEVSKAYRKLSVLVHPDKNPGDAARAAFEALNEAHRLLKDASKLEGILKDHLEAARQRQETALASASLEERVMIQAQQAAAAKALRRAQGESLQADIVAQMRERQEAAKRKREAAEKSRYRRRGEEEGDAAGDVEARLEEERRAREAAAQQQAGSSSDEEDAAARRRALAKRRQKQHKPSGM
ncbi:molecular chaperone [Micractinium conductrix]|uniref:Molecular chaperone n=1 Tax=Micractinium conductrix TaxID=554055 RepID=A0A2P6V991_9CHLO|nr:molecular chaperone [Micractinium conductrix]|eukprot:PSC70653.1 molecular chaperone [Micractinium conductrix]